MLSILAALALAQTGFPIKSGSSSNVADVNATKQLVVTTSIDGGSLGNQALSDHEGDVVGVSEGGRLYVTYPQPLWDDTFNATTQNTAKYRAPVTTQTVTFGSGFVTLNGSAVTSINTNSAYQTYRVFPLFEKSELVMNASCLLTVAPQANAVTELGLFTATLPGAAAPTDGCFFRWNASAEFRGVCSYNGTEVQTAAITAPSASVNHDYRLMVQTNTVKFYVDDVLLGKLTLLTDAPTQGQPMIQGSVPFTMRYYIGGSAPASASQLRCSDVFVKQLGDVAGRSWGEAKSGFGHHGSQGQNGGTMGTTANYANSANPTAAAPTNTTAALGTGLGGQFWETDTLAVTTDGIISSYQVPAGGVNQTPRNLVCTGVGISSYVQTVLVGGPYCAQWSVAYGHTAVSLATAEAATAKAPRRIPLPYTQCVTAAQAVNTKVGADFYMQFQQPIVLAPGEFIQTVKKKVGTAPSSGVIAHVINFDCRHE